MRFLFGFNFGAERRGRFPQDEGGVSRRGRSFHFTAREAARFSSEVTTVE